MSKEGHLCQLVENSVKRQLDELCQVADLHTAERLYEADQVLLQQGVVQGRKVSVDHRIIHQLLCMHLQCFLEALHHICLPTCPCTTVVITCFQLAHSAFDWAPHSLALCTDQRSVVRFSSTEQTSPVLKRQRASS